MVNNKEIVPAALYVFILPPISMKYFLKSAFLGISWLFCLANTQEKKTEIKIFQDFAKQNQP